MCGVLALLFLVIPAVEIYLIIEVGSAIGPWATLGIIAVTAIVGAALARHQGLAALRAIQRALATGREIGLSLVQGALVLVAGVLLCTPGFATDAVGLLCLLPPVRRALAAALIRRWAASGRIVMVGMPPGAGSPDDDDEDRPPPGVIDV